MAPTNLVRDHSKNWVWSSVLAIAMSSPNIMITDVSERSLQPLSPPEDTPESQDPDPSKPVRSIPITVKSIALGTSPGERCRSRASPGAPSSAWRILYTCERDDEERCNERMKSVINTGDIASFHYLLAWSRLLGHTSVLLDSWRSRRWSAFYLRGPSPKLGPNSWALTGGPPLNLGLTYGRLQGALA